jgi:hypothetical protein
MERPGINKRDINYLMGFCKRREFIWFGKWIDYIVTISFMTSFAYPYLFYASYDLPYVRQGHSLDISQLYIIKLNLSWKGLKWIKKLPFSRFANLPCWAEIELQMLCAQILMLAVTEHVVYSHLKHPTPTPKPEVDAKNL